MKNLSFLFTFITLTTLVSCFSSNNTVKTKGYTPKGFERVDLLKDMTIAFPSELYDVEGTTTGDDSQYFKSKRVDDQAVFFEETGPGVAEQPLRLNKPLPKTYNGYTLLKKSFNTNGAIETAYYIKDVKSHFRNQHAILLVSLDGKVFEQVLQVNFKDEIQTEIISIFETVDYARE